MAILGVLDILCCLIFVLILTGCVFGGKRYSHFVGVNNISQDAAFDISYSYGMLQEKEIFTSTKHLAPVNGSTPSYGAIMAVPENATVCWAYRSERYNIVVPVKKHVETPEKLTEIKFMIQDNELFVCVDDEELNCFCLLGHPRSCRKIIGPSPAQKGDCPLPY